MITHESGDDSAPDEPLQPEKENELKEKEEPRGPFKGWGFSVTALTLLVIVAANAFVELDYYVLGPGQTVPVKQFVEIPEDKAHPPKGDLMLTTVSLLRAHPYDIVHAWFTDGTEIESKKDVLGDSTPQQFTQQNADLMDSSQLAAISVAMRKAGYSATLIGDGAAIREVAPGTPAEGKVNAGDLVTAVDGNKVSIASDVTTLIRRKAIGDTVKLTLTDEKGAVRDADITTAALPDDPSRPYVGVVVGTKNARLDTPFPVSFETTDIGGPSAGLAFTLTLLDELTPGELTGGGKVAVTGTINENGDVGQVGGVEQKTISVKNAGAKLFLVPAAEVDVAKKFAGSKLKIVGVNTLDEAVAALGANGGDVASVKALPVTPTA
jgi:PDZ domain-containing protein